MPTRIDAHQHFWRYNPQRDSWITPEMRQLRRDFLPLDFSEQLRSNGMHSSIAVQADQSEDETRFLLGMADKNPEISGVVGWVDLRSPKLRQRLQHFSGFRKLCGFRHIVQSEPDDRFLLRDDFSKGVAQLSEFEFTYDILIYPHQLPDAVKFAQRFPQQKLVLDHMGKPAIRSGEIHAWASHIRKLAELPNVWCKVSGLVTEASHEGWKFRDFVPYLDVAFAAFGPQRLMFGSDWPVCLLAGDYASVQNIIEKYMQKFSELDREAVFGLNAERFYKREMSHK